MDSQNNALFDNPTFPSSHRLDELRFNSTNATSKLTAPKGCNALLSYSQSHGKKYVVLQAGAGSTDDKEIFKKAVNHSNIPCLSTSPSLNKIKHGDVSLTPGDPSLTLSNPNMITLPRLANLALVRSGSYIFNENGSRKIVVYDTSSIRSLASIGMGSTDGRRMVIRKVPNTPSELLSYINPPTPPDELYENESYDISDDIDDDNLKPRRQHWSSKMQFILACIGYSVGLSNVWRFPYIMYKSGGGVFLIPYFITLLLCGIPLLFMSLSIGQFTGRGPIGALGQLCPLLKGTGLASVIVSFLMSTYYSVIIAYSIYFFFTSFRPELPWSECKNPRWTTPDCWTIEKLRMNITQPANPQTPAEEFFQNKVLQMSSGIQYPGGMRWDLVACLICAWILVYFAIWKSIKSSTKIRYFTASFPFVLIVVFLGRALTLEGAEKGLQFFFRTNWSELLNSNIWINAMGQSFSSLGIAFGSMISFASYNKYNNNILHDTLAIASVNFLTSILVGLFAFATIGNIAFEQNLPIGSVVEDGPGLIFIVYPQALARMPGPQLWSVLFFFMLLCLGLNSQFAIVEVVVTSIQDGFPNWIRQKLVYHELLVLIICVIACIFGLPNIIESGIYFFQLIDYYVASVTVLFLAFFQIVAVSWFYGIDRLTKNIKEMTSKNPSMFFRFCWFFASPAILIAIFALAIVNYKPLTYHNGKYIYPEWAHLIGWGITAVTLLCIPVFAIFNICHADGASFYEKLRNTIKPNIYECKICKEHHCEHDFPEEALQEMTFFQAQPIILDSPPLRHTQLSQSPRPPRDENGKTDAPSGSKTQNAVENIIKTA